MKKFYKSLAAALSKIPATLHEFTARHRYLYYLPTVLSFIALLFLVKNYAVNLPFFDDWMLMAQLCKFNQGNLTLADLFSQHNEHRLFLVRLIYIADYLIKPWSMVNIMYVNVMFMCLSALLIFALIKRVYGMNWFFAFLAPLAMLSCAQFLGVLWAICIAHTLSIFFFLAAVYVVTAVGDPLLMLSAAFILCSLSGLSSGNGLLSFIIIAGLLYLRTGQKNGRAWLNMTIWAGLSVIIFLFYFTGYSKPGYHPYITLDLSQVPLILNYLIDFNSGPFRVIFGNNGSVLWGLGIIVAYTYLIIGSFVRRQEPVFPAIASFGFLTACLGAISRSRFFIHQAYAPVYTCYSLLILLGVVVALEPRFPRKGRPYLCTALLLLLLYLSFSSLARAELLHDYMILQQKVFTLALKTGDYSKTGRIINGEPEWLQNIVLGCMKSGVDVGVFRTASKNDEGLADLRDIYGIDFEWKQMHNMEFRRLSDGSIMLIGTGPDPYMTSQPMDLDAREKQEILFLQEKGGDPVVRVQISWITDRDRQWDKAKRISFRAESGEPYNIRIFRHDKWEGHIVQMRIGLDVQPATRTLLKMFHIKGRRK